MRQQGVSVFVGLMLSLGSSGIVNKVMSGLTITYSRALRKGDFVRIGDIEGTVTHMGTLSTKMKTPHREEVTLPNALVASNVTTNYSRLHESEGVFAPTAVTIGYDVPWRQVHALLLLAAERTTGVRRHPASTVRQTGLRDFYVEYTLLVCWRIRRCGAPFSTPCTRTSKMRSTSSASRSCLPIARPILWVPKSCRGSDGLQRRQAPLNPTNR